MSNPHGPGGRRARHCTAASPRQQRQRFPAFRLPGSMVLLLLLLAAGSLLAAPTARADSGSPVLSNPFELTTLAEGGISANLRDSQGHFHLLYTTSTPRITLDLVYREVSINGQSVQVVHQPVTLASDAERILSPTLLLDSQGRVHAAWIEESNGIASVRHALVADPTGASDRPIIPQTLYTVNGAAVSLSAGADTQGDTFYAWLDNASGALNLRFSEIDNTQTAGTPIQATQQTDGLNFPHLVVYPNGTLAVAMLHASPQGGWDLNLYAFDATGKALHAPTLVAAQLRPGSQNIQGKDTNDFRLDPLALVLDAQQKLYLVWSSVSGLGYTTASLQADASFTVQPTQFPPLAFNYLQLCLSVGTNDPSRPPAANQAPTIWLAWLDDSQGTPMHPYIAPISARQTLGKPTPLVDQLTVATDPCVQQDSHGGLYVTWEQFDDNDNFALYMETTTIAPDIPWWARIGLSQNHPIEQLLFMVFGSPMVAFFFILIDVLSVPVALIVIRLGKRLRVPRLLVLLIALMPMLALSIYLQGYLATSIAGASVPPVWSLIGCAVAVGLTVYFWYRSRRFPPETLGTLGRLLLAAYIGAIILAAPIIYLVTRTQLV